MSKLARNEGLPAAEATEDAVVVRAMYRALEGGNLPSLARYADPSIEWMHPAVTSLPFDGTRRGLTAVLQSAFQRDADGMGPRVSADTFLELGDGVLVVGRLLSQGKVEDEPDGVPFLHECFVRGGRVVRLREYPAQSEEGLAPTAYRQNVDQQNVGSKPASEVLEETAPKREYRPQALILTNDQKDEA